MYMTYKELEEEQNKSPDYKIKMAVKAIESGFKASKHNTALAFSGGKDSTVLWSLILTYFPEQAKKQ